MREAQRIAKQAHKANRQNSNFGDWLEYATPTFNWHWRNLVFVRKILARVTAGKLRKLMIFMPPRHGKSEMVTVRYPVWRMLAQPDLRCIIGAYNNDLAMQFSRKGQRVAMEAGLQLAVMRADDWETTAGGGVRATGVGAGITGRGANLIIIDDPVKSREEANSSAYRERCWQWYTNDLYTRLEPNGALILIMTRWHQDDLAGRILDSEDGRNWTVVSMAALAEEGLPDVLHRKPGEALCPERFDEQALVGIRTVLGSWAFAALYQQRPLPREGGMIERAWLPIVKAAPVDIVRRIRYWDKAASLDGKRTAGVRMAKAYSGEFFVEHVICGQWTTHNRRQVMLQTAQMDGMTVEQWIEQEPGSSGVDSVQDEIRLLEGFTARADRPSGDKDTRLEPFAAQAEAGNVKLLEGAWNQIYIDEMTTVPGGAYRDQADATAGAFNKLVTLSAGTGRSVVIPAPDIIDEYDNNW